MASTRIHRLPNSLPALIELREHVPVVPHALNHLRHRHVQGNIILAFVSPSADVLLQQLVIRLFQGSSITSFDLGEVSNHYKADLVCLTHPLETSLAVAVEMSHLRWDLFSISLIQLQFRHKT